MKGIRLHEAHARDQRADDPQEPAQLRIEVRDDSGILSAQARSYAEYRVFASLTRDALAVRAASVELGRKAGHAAGVVCAITITLASTGLVQVRATAKHPYAAIDRAAQRAAEAMHKLSAHGSSPSGFESKR